MKALMKAYAMGVSICFHFIYKIRLKLEWCVHLHAHSGVRWGQDSKLFPLSVFQT